jgi:Phosphatidylinositol N-acetylglucosaminyltransferase
VHTSTIRQRRRLWNDDTVDSAAEAAAFCVPEKENRASKCDDNIDNRWHRNDDEEESYDSLLERFIAPKEATYRRSFFRLCSNAVVVVQEFALTSFLLAKHRSIIMMLKPEQDGGRIINAPFQEQQQWYMTASTTALYAALVLTVVFSAAAASSSSSSSSSTTTSSCPVSSLQQDRWTKARQRTFDAVLLAVLLRWIAALIQSLTASYSTDTVERLVWILLVVHLLFCDYSYANGRSNQRDNSNNSNSDDSGSGSPRYSTDSTTKRQATSKRHAFRRPSFQGGTVSLTAIFFATTLLVSRFMLKSSHGNQQQSVYTFVFLSVVMFSFYPATRHAISSRFPSYTSGMSICLNEYICVCMCSPMLCWPFRLMLESFPSGQLAHYSCRVCRDGLFTCEFKRRRPPVIEWLVRLSGHCTGTWCSTAGMEMLDIATTQDIYSRTMGYPHGSLDATQLQWFVIDTVDDYIFLPRQKRHENVTAAPLHGSIYLNCRSFVRLQPQGVSFWDRHGPRLALVT